MNLLYCFIRFNFKYQLDIHLYLHMQRVSDLMRN